MRGDRNEDCDCEDCDCSSPRLEDFSRTMLEAAEPDLSLREKRPMLAGDVSVPGFLGCARGAVLSCYREIIGSDKQPTPNLWFLTTKYFLSNSGRTS